ncbi:MAG: SDR family NAD(P)-dependent oxidoreductase [Chitinophagales bacterium]
MKKAIIVGASSGIGRSLALELSKRGYQLGLGARREGLLQEIASEAGNGTFIKVMDAENQEALRQQVSDLIREMDGVDLIIYNAGIGESSGQWEKEHQMHEINAIGFAAVANLAFQYFRRNKKEGQFVGISSVAGTRGMRQAIGYSATKAFMQNYLEGQRHKATAEKLPIIITDIRPGFIDTDMTKGQKGMFWVQPVDKAARQIADAIEKKQAVAYITRRWWIIAKLFGAIPDFVWNRL